MTWAIAIDIGATSVSMGLVSRSEPQVIHEVVRWTRHYYFPIPKLPEFRLSEFTKQTAILGPEAAFFTAHEISA